MCVVRMAGLAQTLEFVRPHQMVVWGVPVYFKARACLAAYMNILRRNPSTTCLTKYNRGA